jgi:dihydropteroate synthase
MEMVEQGADIIDIGGESTGPGSKDVNMEEELARVMPVLEVLRKQTDAWISVDTWKSGTARTVLEAGADMINDVTALRGDANMAQTLAGYDVPVVLMYSKDATPRTTREDVHYDDVVETVSRFFRERIPFAEKSGIARGRLVLDPGMGAFVSANPVYSLQLLNRLDQFLEFELPLLVGPSRKSFIGQVLNVPLNQRLEGSLGACAAAVMRGASILRVHDVQETRRLADMVFAVVEEGRKKNEE